MQNQDFVNARGQKTWHCSKKPSSPHQQSFFLSFCHYTFILFNISIPSISSPPSHNSLFEVPGLSSGGDLSNLDDLSSSQTASRPQTFLSQVTMATVPPLFQPSHASVSQAATFPPKPSFPPLPPGSTAVWGQPLREATHAGMQDKGTKRAFVPPMTPQPLRIQGAALH